MISFLNLGLGLLKDWYLFNTFFKLCMCERVRSSVGTNELAAEKHRQEVIKYWEMDQHIVGFGRRHFLICISTKRNCTSSRIIRPHELIPTNRTQQHSNCSIFLLTLLPLFKDKWQEINGETRGIKIVQKQNKTGM